MRSKHILLGKNNLVLSDTGRKRTRPYILDCEKTLVWSALRDVAKVATRLCCLKSTDEPYQPSSKVKSSAPEPSRIAHVVLK